MLVLVPLPKGAENTFIFCCELGCSAFFLFVCLFCYVLFSGTNMETFCCAMATRATLTHGPHEGGKCLVMDLGV